MLTQYSKMTNEEFIAYLHKYTIDGCHPQICEEAAERLKKANGLPCSVGDRVAVRALCECVYTAADNDECRHICPFEDDCEFDDCDNANEKIFETKISSIFNNGSVWELSFAGLGVQARFSDLGRSFFVGENAREQAEQFERELRGRE